MIVMIEIEVSAVDPDTKPDKGDANCQRNNRIYQYDAFSFLFPSLSKVLRRAFSV